MHSLDKKIESYAPGGYHCECCGPAHPHVGRGKYRQFLRRIKRKRIKRELFKYEERAG